MNKIFKLIGKRGRTTVPFEIRMKMRLGYNSLAGLYALFKTTILPSLGTKIGEMFNYAG